MDAEQYWAEILQIDIDRELRLEPLVADRVRPPRDAQHGDTINLHSVAARLVAYDMGYDVGDGIFQRTHPDPRKAPLGLVTASRWHDALMYKALRSVSQIAPPPASEGIRDWFRRVLVTGRPEWLVVSFGLELELEELAGRHRVNVIGCGAVKDGAPALAGRGQPLVLAQGIRGSFKDQSAWPRNVIRVLSLAAAAAQPYAEVSSFVEPVFD